MASADEVAGLSDEAYGVAWAAQQHLLPRPWRFSGHIESHRYRPHCWHRSEVPGIVFDALKYRCHCNPRIADYDTEVDAYAALGAAVRAVHRAVPRLPGE